MRALEGEARRGGASGRQSDYTAAGEFEVTLHVIDYTINYLFVRAAFRIWSFFRTYRDVAQRIK